MYGHLISVNPPPNLEMHVPSVILKKPFCMVFSLVVANLGFDDDSKIKEVSLVLLMLFFLVDIRAPAMFHFVQFIEIHMKEKFITMIQ